MSPHPTIVIEQAESIVSEGSMFADVSWVSRLVLGMCDQILTFVFTRRLPDNMSLFNQDAET